MAALTEITGLRDTLKALELVDYELYAELKAELAGVGEIVRNEAAFLFVEHGQQLNQGEAYAKSAAGFEVRVRPGAGAQVVVAQRLRKTTGTKPDWGAQQMIYGLLPAGERKEEQAALRLEQRVGGLLHRHGLT